MTSDLVKGAETPEMFVCRAGPSEISEKASVRKWGRDTSEEAGSAHTPSIHRVRE